LCTTAAELVEELSNASKKGCLQESLLTYTHPHVLLVDEVGYLTYGPDAANVLFHVVNHRHLRKRPMIFTTNKSLSEWGKVLHDEDLAAAILDRVLERGRFIHLDGPSGRTRHLNLSQALPSPAERLRISGINGSEFPEPTTFGGDLKFNTHLHILISAGGLLESGIGWIPLIELNQDALMRMWRYAVITHLRGAIKAQVFKSHLAVPDLKRILTIAYELHPKWIIFIDKIASKSHFLLYAARYVRRPPLASWRLLEVTDREVLFVAKDTKAKLLVPTRCQLSDFVRLLASHVAERYQHSVRYFGLLSPRARGWMHAALFALLGQCLGPRPQRLGWRDSLRKYFGVDPLADSCGQTMRLVRRERPATA